MKEVEVLTEEEEGLTSLYLEKREKFAQQSNDFKVRCLKVQINNHFDYTVGADLMIDAARQIKDVETFMNEDIKKAFDLHRGLTKKRNAIIDPYKDAKKFVGKLMAKFDDKIETEKKAEAVRLSKGEADRVEAERKRLSESRDAEADIYKKSGDEETAIQIRKKPLPPVTTSVPLSTIEKPKAEGISFTVRYRMKVVVPELVPEKYKIINQALLDKQANDFKGEIKITGCVVVKEKIPNTRIA